MSAPIRTPSPAPATAAVVAGPAAAPVDRLSSLLEHFRVRARLFHVGPLCGISPFDPLPGRGFLHVMQRGEMELRHPAGAGLPRKLRVDEPSLLFYPRPVAHEFRNPPRDGSDFTCAELEFDGGVLNPLVRALPPLVLLPLAKVSGLELSLQLLFSETERARCGQRLLADRLFEVVLIQLLRWLIDHPAEAGVQPGLVSGLSDPRIALALAAVHEAPGQAWSLARMAERAGMSRSAFAARFRDLVGQAPAAYLADWRLSLAQEQLRLGRPIKQIADQLGYANASALSRVFTQRVGRSPREWKQALGAGEPAST
ncbi:cupin domain-containing protein [Roseateles sp. 22389]|uniref:cupin domain-containing protein n=1 Tax=Roseateles sp. 22389 TaxID=3453916 RepID=UPI003F8384D5